MCVCVMESLIL